MNLKETFNKFCHWLVGFTSTGVLAVDYGAWPVTIVLAYMFLKYEGNEELNLGRFDPAYEEIREFLIGAVMGVPLIMISEWL